MISYGLICLCLPVVLCVFYETALHIWEDNLVGQLLLIVDGDEGGMREAIADANVGVDAADDAEPKMLMMLMLLMLMRMLLMLMLMMRMILMMVLMLMQSCCCRRSIS